MRTRTLGQAVYESGLTGRDNAVEVLSAMGLHDAPVVSPPTPGEPCLVVTKELHDALARIVKDCADAEKEGREWRADYAANDILRLLFGTGDVRVADRIVRGRPTWYGESDQDWGLRTGPEAPDPRNVFKWMTLGEICGVTHEQGGEMNPPEVELAVLRSRPERVDAAPAAITYETIEMGDDVRQAFAEGEGVVADQEEIRRMLG